MRLVRASVRLAILILASAVQVLAGDVAQVEFLGFSEDGDAYFVEYGRQDGSGFPYANLSKASEEGSTPVERVVLSEPSKTALDARIQLTAPERLQGLESSLMVYDRLHTDPGSQASVHRFFPSQHLIEDELLEVAISISAAPAGRDCYGMFEVEQALSLTVGRTKDRQIMLADRLQPEGCAQNFRLGRAFVSYNAKGQRQLALLLMVDRLGFEGFDVRWIGFSVLLQD